jgi:AcrR family transcriptional regulator
VPVRRNSSGPPGDPGRRRRRPTAEIRPAILKAAREEFAERTYSAARTKSIAERAQVAENMIFDHFGSKQALFREAVIAHLEDFLRSWTATIKSATWGADAAEAELTEYFTVLVRTLVENRSVLAAYFASVSLDPDALADGVMPTGWSEALSSTDELAEQFARFHQLKFEDTRRQVRIILASVVGIALFGETFLGADFEPGAVAEVMAHRLLHGVASPEVGPGTHL